MHPSHLFLEERERQNGQISKENCYCRLGKLVSYPSQPSMER